MKMVKKFLSAGLCAAMMLSSVSVFAEDTSVSADAITIDSVAFSAVEGDDTLVKATVAFTAVTPDEVTILMATKDAITVDDTDDVMYINQVARPQDGILEFVIEKSRILASKGEGATDVNNTTMFVKMGGTDIDTMASNTGVINLVTHIPGDANGDKIVSIDDANAIARHLANWDDYKTVTPGMNCNGDDVVSIDDANAIARHLANWDDYKTLK